MEKKIRVAPNVARKTRLSKVTRILLVDSPKEGGWDPLPECLLLIQNVSSSEKNPNEKNLALVEMDSSFRVAKTY